MNNKDQVIRLLTYYFRLLFEKSGLKFDNDNYSEITEIVDLIYEDIMATLKK